MKIWETIERQCCQRSDLKLYKGCIKPEFVRFRPRFCHHCGQVWIETTQMGPAGSSDPVDRRVILDNEATWEE